MILSQLDLLGKYLPNYIADYFKLQCKKVITPAYKSSIH